ncbi:MAG: hypothetical protein JJU37_04870 [Balneolaceae bacterium]|nr:hypothetical protein [Balneolaceae bacterium]
MSSIIWVLIPLVAIIGAYIIDYQKNKLKWQAKSSEKEQELEEVRADMEKLKKRIENLEAIATEEPLSGLYSSQQTGFAAEDSDSIKKENEHRAANKAKLKNR